MVFFHLPDWRCATLLAKNVLCDYNTEQIQFKSLKTSVWDWRFVISSCSMQRSEELAECHAGSLGEGKGMDSGLLSLTRCLKHKIRLTLQQPSLICNVARQAWASALWRRGLQYVSKHLPTAWACISISQAFNPFFSGLTIWAFFSEGLMFFSSTPFLMNLLPRWKWPQPPVMLCSDPLNVGIHFLGPSPSGPQLHTDMDTKEFNQGHMNQKSHWEFREETWDLICQVEQPLKRLIVSSACTAKELWGANPNIKAPIS